MTPKWREFETAVASFAQKLDANALVLHDARMPDRDTGRLRQRDVWIETKFGGVIPIRILVSCKDKKAKLSQQDIDAFAGELRSSTAHKGVLYARSGFTAGAVEKARKLGICCCVLYDDRPTEPPPTFSLASFYFGERVRLTVTGNPGTAIPTVGEFFEMETHDGSGVSVIDALSAEYDAARLAAGAIKPADGIPATWTASVSVTNSRLDQPATIKAESSWLAFKAKIDAFGVSGSYSATESQFHGSVATPWVDTWSVHPGPGWEPFDPAEPPAERGITASIIKGGGSIGPDLIAHFGAQSFAEAFPAAEAVVDESKQDV